MTPPTPSKPVSDAKDRRSGQERNTLLNSPQSDWARKPNIRRLLVVGYLATTLGMAAVFGLVRDLTFVIAILIGTVVYVLLIGSLNAATRGLIDLKTGDIDERQRQQRGAIYERSYWIAAVSTVVILYAATSAAFRDHLPTEGRTWGALLVAAFAVLGMLPTLVTAWNRID